MSKLFEILKKGIEDGELVIPTAELVRSSYLPYITDENTGLFKTPFKEEDIYIFRYKLNEPKEVLFHRDSKTCLDLNPPKSNNRIYLNDKQTSFKQTSDIFDIIIHGNIMVRVNSVEKLNFVGGRDFIETRNSNPHEAIAHYVIVTDSQIAEEVVDGFYITKIDDDISKIFKSKREKKEKKKN